MISPLYDKRYKHRVQYVADPTRRGSRSGGTAQTVPHKKRPQTDCDTLQTALSSMTFSWCCHNIVSSKSQLPNLWWVEVTPGVLAHLDNQSERQQRIVGVGGVEGWWHGRVSSEP